MGIRMPISWICPIHGYNPVVLKHMFLGASWVLDPVLGAEDREMGSGDEALLSMSFHRWVGRWPWEGAGQESLGGLESGPCRVGG